MSTHTHTHTHNIQRTQILENPHTVIALDELVQLLRQLKRHPIRVHRIALAIITTYSDERQRNRRQRASRLLCGLELQGVEQRNHL
jgi:hypothetical protein